MKIARPGILLFLSLLFAFDASARRTTTIAESLGGRCYGIEADGHDAIRVRVYRTGYSLGKFRSLWNPPQDGCPRNDRILESGDEVVVRKGERLGFHLAEHRIAGPAAALYVLSGKDIPQDVKCPEVYRTSPLIIGYAVEHCGMESGYGGYLICPERNRAYNLKTDGEELLYFPFRTTDIPPTSYAPMLAGAPERNDFSRLQEDAELVKNVYESEFCRLSAAKVIESVRTMNDGRQLVRFPSRAPFVIRTCGIIRDAEDGEKRLIAVAEVFESGVTGLARYDGKGRIRWYRFIYPKHGECRAGDRCHRFPGDGTVAFSCERFTGENYRAFAFKNQKVRPVADGVPLRKYLEEADENFRRAFGFIGSGELTIDQVKKGLE